MRHTYDTRNSDRISNWQIAGTFVLVFVVMATIVWAIGKILEAVQ